MSRKTLRNASKNAFKKNVNLGALGRTAYAKIGISGLALGSITLGVGGVAHAQNAPTRKNSDQPAVPAKAAKAKRRGFKATPMASQGMLARNGAGLYAQNTAQPGPTIAAANTKGESSATALAPIIVTGMRGSLLRSLAIKRESIGVVDAISAESIGQFPDSSVAARSRTCRVSRSIAATCPQRPKARQWPRACRKASTSTASAGRSTQCW